jgi:transcriptional regulator with XRE-family HTH domain
MKPIELNPVRTPSNTSPLALSELLKSLRKERGWTLATAAEAAGVAKSTLSKIENGQMSPTYDMLLKLATGYSVDIADFFAPASTKEASGRMAVTRRGEGRLHKTKLYDHEVLAAQLSRKRIMPFHSRIKALAEDEEIEWSSHDGEEFLFVISGSVTVMTEHYEPVTLETGDSIYIDSGMAHAVVANTLVDGGKDAEVVWVTAV